MDIRIGLVRFRRQNQWARRQFAGFSRLSRAVERMDDPDCKWSKSVYFDWREHVQKFGHRGLDVLYPARATPGAQTVRDGANTM